MTRLLLGDNIESLKKLEDNSIDSIVSDPPYGLSFMNKKWDYDVPSVEFWREVYRVLKPGGHVLSFGGTRTYHRMAVNIEDAGFEIRDQIMWLYGSGFPKSHNIGKSVDKIRGNDREVVGERKADDIKGGKMHACADRGHISLDITKGNSEWEGWGTALKPANEPICLARKPLSEKTIVDNVLRWGTGGINIDGCRVAYASEADEKSSIPGSLNSNQKNSSFGIGEGHEHNTEGRFPANIILDEEAGQALDEQSGVSKSQGKSKVVEGKEANIFNDGENKASGHKKKMIIGDYSDKGGASRFFYQAKVGKKERNMGLEDFQAKQPEGLGHGLDRICSICEAPQLKPCDCKDNKWVLKAKKNTHPTVKPVSLMAYLCRLITPPNGIVLDPFMGSGSTGIAANLEGFSFVGMEMDEDYFKIAEARIEDYEKYREFVEPNKNLKNGNTRMATRSDSATSLGLGICKK